MKFKKQNRGEALISDENNRKILYDYSSGDKGQMFPVRFGPTIAKG
jgi:hypothetical protein